LVRVRPNLFFLNDFSWWLDFPKFFLNFVKFVMMNFGLLNGALQSSQLLFIEVLLSFLVMFYSIAFSLAVRNPQPRHLLAQNILIFKRLMTTNLLISNIITRIDPRALFFLPTLWFILLPWFVLPILGLKFLQMRFFYQKLIKYLKYHLSKIRILLRVEQAKIKYLLNNLDPLVVKLLVNLVEWLDIHWRQFWDAWELQILYLVRQRLVKSLEIFDVLLNF